MNNEEEYMEDLNGQAEADAAAQAEQEEAEARARDEPDGMLALAKGVHDQTFPHTIDATIWASQWMKTIAAKPEIATDEATMLGWFANAIMAGYDTANARQRAEVMDIQKNVTALLRNVGDAGTCRGCGAPIYWITHKNGKKAPYTGTGLNHFADCPKSKDFKR